MIPKNTFMCVFDGLCALGALEDPRESAGQRTNVGTRGCCCLAVLCASACAQGRARTVPRDSHAAGVWVKCAVRAASGALRLARGLRWAREVRGKARWLACWCMLRLLPRARCCGAPLRLASPCLAGAGQAWRYWRRWSSLRLVAGRPRLVGSAARQHGRQLSCAGVFSWLTRALLARRATLAAIGFNVETVTYNNIKFQVSAGRAKPLISRS